MRPNYAILVRALPADSLEDFVNDWLAQRVKDYVGFELWRGTGDMGRDVTGYLTAERMEGPWDNFQCKQLAAPLSETASFIELGKIFRHSAGAYSLPRSYTYVAPRGVSRGVRQLIAHPERFRREFLGRWNAEIASRLVERQVIPLSIEIEAKIMAFDFQQVHWLDAARLVNHPAAKPALVHWFGDDPGRSPRGAVPAQVQLEESAYIGQLLRLYEEKGLAPIRPPRRYSPALSSAHIYGTSVPASSTLSRSIASIATPRQMTTWPISRTKSTTPSSIPMAKATPIA